MSKKMQNKPFAAALSMAGESAVIDVTGVIGWDADAMQFNNLVDQAKEAGATSLTVRINSVGGYCYDGLSMGDKLLTCGLPTRGEVHGCAMSMASYLLQCCTTRVAHRNATLMFHQPSACICGTVDEMLQEATYLVGMRDRMFEQMGSRCGKSGAELSAEHMTTKYYTAEQALAYGFLDAIVGEEVPAEAPSEVPSEDEPASACRVFSYDRAARIAMMEDEPQEDDAEETPQEPAEEPAEPGEDNVPAEDETPQEEPAEPQETPETPEDEPAEVPSEEPSEEPEEETVTLTREELEDVVARGAARAVAALGIPAASLVSPVAPAASAAAGPAYTRAELDAMPGMARLRLLRENPALAARYMNS